MAAAEGVDHVEVSVGLRRTTKFKIPEECAQLVYGLQFMSYSFALRKSHFT